MMKFVFEEIAAESIPLEELRIAFGALVKMMGLEVLRKEGFYGDTEYSVRQKPRPSHWATPIGACVHCKQLPCACAVALSASTPQPKE